MYAVSFMFKTFLDLIIACCLQMLTVVQLKKLSQLAAEWLKKCDEDRVLAETRRAEYLREIGNILHDSVPVSNDEVRGHLRMC